MFRGIHLPPIVYFHKIIEPNKMKTFLELLIELSEQGCHLTDEDIRDEVSTLLIGVSDDSCRIFSKRTSLFYFKIKGSDTTSSTQSFALMMLGMHPEIQVGFRYCLIKFCC